MDEYVSQDAFKMLMMIAFISLHRKRQIRKNQLSEKRSRAMIRRWQKNLRNSLFLMKMAKLYPQQATGVPMVPRHPSPRATVLATWAHPSYARSWSHFWHNAFLSKNSPRFVTIFFHSLKKCFMQAAFIFPLSSFVIPSLVKHCNVR